MIWGAAAIAASAALLLRDRSFLDAARATIEPFATVAGVVAAGWLIVRAGWFERLAARLPLARPRVAVAWVILITALISGLINLDVAVVVGMPLALTVAAATGVSAGWLAIGVANVANAASFLLPTSNLTNLLVMGPVRPGPAAYLSASWLVWTGVVAVTTAAIVLVAGRSRGEPGVRAANVAWSLRWLMVDLAAMFLIASGLRAFLAGGITLPGGFALQTATGGALASVFNNLPDRLGRHRDLPSPCPRGRGAVLRGAADGRRARPAPGPAPGGPLRPPPHGRHLMLPCVGVRRASAWARRVGFATMRRRAIATVVTALAGAVLCGGVARAQASENIRSYDVQIQIQHDDSLRITETIEYDFGGQPHHGIFRDIPTSLHFDDTYDRSYPLKVESVTGSPGTPVNYSVKGIADGKTELKIGDPDQTVTGVHTYTLVYSVGAALNGFGDHDELFWNAIGDEWEVGIGQASATVTAPGAIEDVKCFTGSEGSHQACDSARSKGSTARFSQTLMFPYSALTVVVALPKGVVTDPTPTLVARWSLKRAFSLTPATGGTSAGLLILAVGGFAGLLWTRGRDRRFVGSDVDQVMGNPAGQDQRVPLLQGGASAPVEFAPPEDLRPGQVGTLMDEQANTLDVTATIIDLAVRGFLTIEEIPKHGWFGKPDWKLTRLDKAGEELLPYEQKLLDGLFLSGTDVTVSSLRATFAARLEGVETALYADAMKQKWFSARPDKVRATWMIRAVLVFVAGCALTFVLARWTRWGLVGIPVVLAGLLLMVGAHRMPARTAKGRAMLMRLRGFRTVIEKADTNLSHWAEQANVFTRFLPYAIVFGCTEKWAKAFEGLAQPPDTSWYVSSTPFLYANFAHSIDGFAVATGGTIASTPSGSGSSGFGGGGFSGGGGGGGGGGSW